MNISHNWYYEIFGLPVLESKHLISVSYNHYNYFINLVDDENEYDLYKLFLYIRYLCKLFREKKVFQLFGLIIARTSANA